VAHVKGKLRYGDIGLLVNEPTFNLRGGVSETVANSISRNSDAFLERRYCCLEPQNSIAETDVVIEVVFAGDDGAAPAFAEQIPIEALAQEARQFIGYRVIGSSGFSEEFHVAYGYDNSTGIEMEISVVRDAQPEVGGVYFVERLVRLDETGALNAAGTCDEERRRRA
jgi:hypothetical protein